MPGRKLEYIAGSWQGLQRPSNKDGYHVIASEQYHLFFIFDGVSSSKNASLGIKTVIDFCNNSHGIYYKHGDFHLKYLMEDMNIAILRSHLEAAETTCCCVYIPRERSGFIKYSHLGDSRVYALKEDFTCLTTDHNDGVFSHMLTKCLGLKRLKEDDFYEKNLHSDPLRLFLCTDGFYNVMEEDFTFFSGLLREPLDQFKQDIEKFIYLRNADDATYLFIDLPPGKL